MQLDAAYTEFILSYDYTRSSRDWYESRLHIFFAWAREQGVTELESITAPLVRRYAEARKTDLTKDGTIRSTYTLHGDVRAVKTFLNWAGREELVDERITRRVAMPVREIKVIKTLSDSHLARLFAACDCLRDKVILSVLLDTGIRANELCTLTLDHTTITPDDAYIIVNGKGRKQREVGLGKRSRTGLSRYIHRERGHTTSPYVFMAKGGKPLAVEGLDRLLYRLRDKAGEQYFAGVRVSAHTFRHTFACRFMEAGGDVYKLSRLLGHASLIVTENYLRAFTSQQARRGMFSVVDGM